MIIKLTIRATACTPSWTGFCPHRLHQQDMGVNNKIDTSSSFHWVQQNFGTAKSNHSRNSDWCARIITSSTLELVGFFQNLSVLRLLRLGKTVSEPAWPLATKNISDSQPSLRPHIKNLNPSYAVSGRKLLRFLPLLCLAPRKYWKGIWLLLD